MANVVLRYSRQLIKEKTGALVIERWFRHVNLKAK